MYVISNSLLLAHISFHLYSSTQKTLGKKKSSIKTMEITFLPLAFSLILITITLISTFRRRCRATGGSAAAALPPGTFGWPFSGETFHFLFGKPENFVGHRMKKYSPDIFRTKILGEKTAVICGPAGHKFVFSNENRLFAPFRPHPMQHLFRSYQNKAGPPPPDEASKSIRQPGFLKPEALARYLPDMHSVAQNLLRAHLFGKNEARIYPFAKSLTLTLACRFFLGIDDPTRITRLVGKFDDVTLGMHSVMVNLPGTAFYRANRAAVAIRKELIAVIKERKREMADSSGGRISKDILSHMIVVTDPTRKPMPDPEIADKIMGLLTASYSTVATTITFLMKYVGLNPKVYRKIREEQMEIAGSKKAGALLEWDDMGKMKYSWNVVCETMRLVPPLQGTFREVITEFTYAGYTVPKGWKVYWTVSTTNMNPDYFKEPEKFNPSRYEEGKEAPPPYTYVPFGGGPRMCPGKEYARLAILAFVHNVVKSYRWEVIDPNEKVEGDMMPEPEKGLPVRLYHV